MRSKILTRKPAIWVSAIVVAAAALTAAAFIRARRTSYYRIRYGDPKGRAQAARELAEKVKGSGVPSLVVALDDEDAEVRRLAIHGLAGFRATEGLARCRELLADDGVPSVRATAAAFLGEVPSPENAPVLVSALNDAEERVRAAACQALGKLHARGAVGNLLERLEDESETVREEAIVALGKLRAKSAVPALAARLDEEDEVPISRIQEALTAIVGRNLGIDAAAWTGWYQSSSEERE